METQLFQLLLNYAFPFKSYYVVWKQALSEEIEADEEV